MTPTEAAIAVLNRAFAADPQAMQCLMAIRVVCNHALADDPSIICDSGSDQYGPTIGPIGLVNGVLAELGLPKIAAMGVTDARGNSALLGFCEYAPTPTESEPGAVPGDTRATPSGEEKGEA